MLRSLKFTSRILLALALMVLCLGAPQARANHYVVSCVGDSLTQGKYPGHLSLMLRNYPYHTFSVYDFGIGGLGSYEIYTYAGWWLAVHPDIVLVMVGTNDLFGATLNASNMELNTSLTMVGTRNIITAAKNSKNPPPYVILAAIPPSKDGNMNARVDYYNQVMERDLASDYDLFIWDNYYTLKNEDGSVKTNLLGDTLHPESSVYPLWADNWYKAIVDLLNEPDRAKESPYE